MINTEGWCSFDIEAAGGHSSVLLDGLFHPLQQLEDAGEYSWLVLVAATCPWKSLAHDSNEHVSISHYCCKWPTAVALSEVVSASMFR